MTAMDVGRGDAPEPSAKQRRNRHARDKSSSGSDDELIQAQASGRIPQQRKTRSRTTQKSALSEQSFRQNTTDAHAQGATDTKSAVAQDKQPAHIEREFGGAWGTAAIMVASHILLYYAWICLDTTAGALVGPAQGEGAWAFMQRMMQHVFTHAAPTWAATAWYTCFIVSQALFSAFLPGIPVHGLKLADGTRKLYNCNGLAAWYLTLVLVAAGHFAGVAPLTAPVRMLGPLLTVAVIAGNGFAALTHASAYWFKQTHRVTGNIVYDYFMGAILNPRLFGGRLDLKMWAETRVSWTLLFLVTLSAAAEQWATKGHVSGPMAFMLLAHFLYANATMKGEECIPTTWDIFHENWGWMLCFWNLAGVPFMYSWQSVLILRNDIAHAPAYTAAITALLIAAYFVWDTANSQKNRFRMQRNGGDITRSAFPQLPWGTLKDPEVLETEAGTPLLVDGWWRFVRKPHYTADLAMAFSWGAICGFTHVLPWVYFAFFCAVLTHRAVRDVQRCSAKYGKDWQRYSERVPYTFVPYVF